ncbi:MAG TPA: acetyl-CoA carboxylase biotin carboxyl carrier protein [Crocinitomicaceae bacterium]|nr:acetyl-CoA carboxylase biotin carboxyl carrier protein [Crocinitomicaceae bacterium]
MNIKEIQDLIKFVAKSGVNEVEIEQKDFKIVIKADNNKKKGKLQEQIIVQAAAPVAQVAAPVVPVAIPAASVETAIPAEEDSKYITVKSPMIGTFYRSSSPDKPPFVEVGDTIKEGDAICIIEAMKLFNEIEAEVTGKIVKVLVDDSTPVQYDQPLFLVDPS